MTVVQQEKQKTERTEHRNRDDMEFMPAALEILETPASPVKIAMMVFISLLVCLALLWAWLGKFDIVATAQGKIQPSGRVKVVQVGVMGKVISHPMANGTRVKAGQELLVLDNREVLAEYNQISAQLAAWRGEAYRRETTIGFVEGRAAEGVLKLAGNFHQREIRFPKSVPELIARREQTVFQADILQLITSIGSLAAKIDEQRVEAVGLGKTIAAQEALLRTMDDRIDIRSALLAKNTGTRDNLISSVEIRQKQEAELSELRGRLLQAQASQDVTRRDAEKLVYTFVAEHRQKYADAQKNVDELAQNLKKLQTRLEQMRIVSPIDGTIQASALTTQGQIVEAGAELMRIVPDEARLEIEAYLPNREIGFVEPGQEAVIKVEAFPYNRYGGVKGRVLTVAKDAIPEPDAQQTEQSAASSLRSIVPIGNVQRMQNLVFPITVSPDEDFIRVDKKEVSLVPGMAVSVEIKTGERRILEYLLSPIAQVSSEAMKER